MPFVTITRIPAFVIRVTTVIIRILVD